jgi:hypothetical protein
LAGLPTLPSRRAAGQVGTDTHYTQGMYEYNILSQICFQRYVFDKTTFNKVNI